MLLMNLNISKVIVMVPVIEFDHSNLSRFLKILLHTGCIFTVLQHF